MPLEPLATLAREAGLSAGTFNAYYLGESTMEGVPHDLDDDEFLYQHAIDRGRWFTRIATLRYDSADRIERAQQAFDEAESLAPGRADPQLGLAMVAFLRGDVRDREHSAENRRTPWVRSVIERAHRTAAAQRGGYPAASAEPDAGANSTTRPEGTSK